MMVSQSDNLTASIWQSDAVQKRAQDAHVQFERFRVLAISELRVRGFEKDRV
jgi:hypothetical protein